jgi:predicted short-subunit dehydrogenase-like oxidoreductase (DUF2520 family)
MSLTLPTAPPLRVVLIGAGKVGTAVAEMLRGAGHDIVGVASRTTRSARAGAERLSASSFDVTRELPPCDVVLIATNDDAIQEVARHAARHSLEDVVVWHLAGYLGTEPLSPAASAGGRTCAAHPVASCPSLDAALRRLPGCTWGVSGHVEVRSWAAAIVERDLRGRTVAVREEDRALWHAAAVTTANGVAALVSSGERLLAHAGVAQPFGVLGPLCRGVIANIDEMGSADEALTGPVVRGDTATIAQHVSELQARAPDLAGAYVATSRLVLASALRSGRLDATRGRDVERALEATWT